MTSWHSYPKVWNLGHSALQELLHDPVIVEEKIDGSQFSFGKFDGKLKLKSKGAEIFLEDPEKMFSKAVETVLKIQDLLIEGWTYRTEYLRTPNHNALVYDRTPKDHLIVFDINPAEEVYLPYFEKKMWAEHLGLECVPCLYSGTLKDVSQVYDLLELTSCLGGQKIEGIVIKNYEKFGPDKKVLLGKHVREDFKEINKKMWMESNPKQGDILALLADKFTTPARWEKAILHLREKGAITDSPKDIGSLMKEVKEDVLAECKEEIMNDLFSWAWPQVQRKLSRGLPEWYKDRLLKRQFEGQPQ